MHPLSPSPAIPQTGEPRRSEQVTLPAKGNRTLSKESVSGNPAWTNGETHDTHRRVLHAQGPKRA